MSAEVEQHDGPLLELDGVQKRFGKLEVLRGIDLEVKRGEVVCVLGPSGSGKSTLLRCINLLEPPEGGRILINGHEITGDDPAYGVDYVRERVGMVFQQFNLFPHKSAIDNVRLAQEKVLGPHRPPRRRRRPARCSPGSGCPTRRTSIPSGSPVASSSGSRSPGRWRWTRRSCSSTRSPPRSTRSWSRRCST